MSQKLNPGDALHVGDVIEVDYMAETYYLWPDDSEGELLDQIREDLQEAKAEQKVWATPEGPVSANVLSLRTYLDEEDRAHCVARIQLVPFEQPLEPEYQQAGVPIWLFLFIAAGVVAIWRISYVTHDLQLITRDIREGLREGGLKFPYESGFEIFALAAALFAIAYLARKATP